MALADMIMSIFKDLKHPGQYEINKKSSWYFIVIFVSLWALAVLDLIFSVDVDIAFWEFLTITISAYIIGKSKSDGNKGNDLAAGNQINTTLAFRIKFARYILAISVLIIYGLLLIQTEILIKGTLTPDMLLLDSSNYGSFNTLAELAIAYLVLDGIW